MKMVKNFAIVAALAMTLLLAACGGGGDAGSPATGSVTSADCTIPDGKTFCETTVVWATANAGAPRLTAGNVLLSSLPSGTTTVAIPFGSTTLALADNTITLASKAIVASCGAESVAIASVCTKPSGAQHPLAAPSIPLAQAPAAAQAFAKEMKAKGAVKKSANPADPYNGVGKTEAFRQGHVFAEENYPEVFIPGSQTETYLPGDGTVVEYRKYWNAHYGQYLYLGFSRDVPAGSGWVEAGVYLMGGPWGYSPVFFGIISDYYTPQGPVYKYPAINLALRSDVGKTIWWFDEMGATQLVNSTGYVDGAFYPIAGCALYDKVLPDDRPLASCLTPGAGNVRRMFPIDPSTKELLPEYTGPVPEGAILRDVFYGTFGDTPYQQYDVGMHGMYVDVDGVGTFYFTNNDDKLRLTVNSFVTNTLVSDGSYQLLMRFPAR